MVLETTIFCAFVVEKKKKKRNNNDIEVISQSAEKQSFSLSHRFAH